MEKTQLVNLQQWFDTYLKGMYGSDEFINANLKLKEEHCIRTASEMRYLADSLNLPQEEKYLAEAIGLLHDIGRFEQFVVYQTYNDGRSTNHGRLGIKVLREDFVLEGIDQQEMSVIETSVEYHGVKLVPSGLSGKRLQFTRLIRDADKIDIFVVVRDNYKQYLADPQKYHIEIEFPLKGGCSPEIINAVLKGEPVDYRLVRSMDDFRLLQMGWVFDMNFVPSIRRVKERGLLDEIAQMLPQNPDVQGAVQRIMSYVEERLAKAV